MENFTAHQLHFTCQVQTPILLNEHQGSAIRGALFQALRNQFCFNKEAKGCGECALWATCPICFLVATRNPQSERGVEVPRPYTIEPPIERMNESTNIRIYESTNARTARKFVNSSIRRYEPGETLQFGLTLFAQASISFPTWCWAARRWNAAGWARDCGERTAAGDGGPSPCGRSPL